MFIFDESPQRCCTRCAQLGIDLQAHVDGGVVTLQQVDPAELTPGELVHAIRTAVEEGNAR